MYHDLGQGQEIELEPPSSTGVDVLYSYQYMLRKIRRRPDSNLYRYADGNPAKSTDPTGLEPVATGVRVSEVYEKGPWFWSLFSAHSFIVFGGVGYGIFEIRHNAIGTAVLRSDELQRYPEADPATLANGQWYSVSYDVKLDDRCYDIPKFAPAVQAFINQARQSPGKFIVFVEDCDAFVHEAINAGMAAAEKPCCKELPNPYQYYGNYGY